MKNGTVISGKLNIGEVPRVSDLFRKSAGEFIVLADANVKGESGKVIIINTTEIMWVEL